MCPAIPPCDNDHMTSFIGAGNFAGKYITKNTIVIMQILFSYGQYGGDMYLVTDGVVRVYSAPLARAAASVFDSLPLTVSSAKKSI